MGILGGVKWLISKADYNGPKQQGTRAPVVLNNVVTAHNRRMPDDKFGF